jgi:hypothetical protein
VDLNLEAMREEDDNKLDARKTMRVMNTGGLLCG